MKESLCVLDISCFAGGTFLVNSVTGKLAVCTFRYSRAYLFAAMANALIIPTEAD